MPIEGHRSTPIDMLIPASDKIGEFGNL